MSIFRKMSARDRSLIILMLAAVIFFICYTFIMSPSMEAATILKGNLATAQSELSQAQDISGKAPELQTQERKQREELIKKYSGFFFDLSQSRLLNKMDSLMIGTGLPATSYLASPEVVSQVPLEQGVFAPQQYPLKDLAVKINPSTQDEPQNVTEGQNPADASNQAETVPAGEPQAVEASDMIPSTDVSVGFTGASYESIYNFIGMVEKMNKTVVIKSADITKDETGLGGQIVFSFYSLPKLDPEQKDGLDYDPVVPAGKANPFL